MDIRDAVKLGAIDRSNVLVTDVSWRAEPSEGTQGLWRVVADGPHEHAEDGQVYVVQDMLKENVARRMAGEDVAQHIASPVSEKTEDGQ